MAYQVSDWVEHPAYGRGQIVSDLGTYWVIHYAETGEKNIIKSFQQHRGEPPYPGFVFPKAGGSKGKSAAKKSTKTASKAKSVPAAPEPSPVG